MYFCWRIHHDVEGWVYQGDTRNGFGMFFDTGRHKKRQADHIGKGRRSTPSHRVLTQPTGSRESRRQPDCIEVAEYLRQHMADSEERARMSRELGVHPDSMRRLRVGYVPDTQQPQSDYIEPAHYLFPERDHTGKVIGLLRRYITGSKQKLQFPGSKRGLHYDPDQEPDPQGVVYIVEGASDVAAAMTLGLHAIGRPNNLGGAEMIAGLLAPAVSRGTKVVVLGENDQKPDGKWPGKEGAITVATQLARLLNVPIGWSLPPSHTKDLRTWMWSDEACSPINCRFEGGFSREKFDPLDDQKCQKMTCTLLGYIHSHTVLVMPGGESMNAPSDWIITKPTTDIPIMRKSDKVVLVPDCTIRIDKGGMGGEEVDSVQASYIRLSGTRTREVANSLLPGQSSGQSSGVLTCRDHLSALAVQIIEDGRSGRPCPRHHTPLLQSRDNPRQCMALRVDCATFRCDVCGARKRSAWLLHLMVAFDTVQNAIATGEAIGEELSLHVCISNATSLKKTKQRIKNRKANYVVFQRHDSQVVVIADRMVGGFAPSDPANAVALVAESLCDLSASARKPITTSKGWAMVERRQRSNYKRVGAAARGAYPKVLSDLERRRLRPQTKEIPKGEKAAWAFRADAAEEEVEEVMKYLSAIGKRREDRDGVEMEQTDG